MTHFLFSFFSDPDITQLSLYQKLTAPSLDQSSQASYFTDEDEFD